MSALLDENDVEAMPEALAARARATIEAKDAAEGQVQTLEQRIEKLSGEVQELKQLVLKLQVRWVANAVEGALEDFCTNKRSVLSGRCVP